MKHPHALIAEDEPLLAQHLQQLLTQTWPELEIIATVNNGLAAVEQALTLQPDLLFLDVRMPEQSGLDAALELADSWPEAHALPALVMVTAYEQYALQAFEACAMDYLLKPVQRARLERTVARLQEWWAQRQGATTSEPLHQLAQLQEQLRSLQSNGVPALQILQASVGNQIQMVPVNDVVYFEAADKYVRVLTAEQEFLLRTPLKELLPQLDAKEFWQVHRGTVVRASSIASARRDEAGRLWLELRQRPEKLAVSRLYATRFKAM